MLEHPCHTVITIEPNGPPLDLTAQAISSTSITISWFPPSDVEQNGIIISYSISVSRIGLNRLLESSAPREIYPASRQNTLIISELQIFTEYSITITALNFVGSGNVSLPVNIITLPTGMYPK